jgi:hypothetical protein
MINPVSFVVMAPLNLGLTIYPKALRNGPSSSAAFVFGGLSDAESATNLPSTGPLTTTDITCRSARLREP